MDVNDQSLQEEFKNACMCWRTAIEEKRFDDAAKSSRKAWDVAHAMEDSGCGLYALMAVKDELETMAAVGSLVGKTLEEIQKKYKDCNVLKNTNKLNG